jgi:hypothetical protein
MPLFGRNRGKAGDASSCSRARHVCPCSPSAGDSDETIELSSFAAVLGDASIRCIDPRIRALDGPVAAAAHYLGCPGSALKCIGSARTIPTITTITTITTISRWMAVDGGGWRWTAVDGGGRGSSGCCSSVPQRRVTALSSLISSRVKAKGKKRSARFCGQTWPGI